MRFSILTPCYNALPYLPACVASVKDQQGPAVEHWILDGGSTDGTVDWLKRQGVPADVPIGNVPYALRWLSQTDRGMYDALNRGLNLATGQVWAYLNADEQYLPGAFAAVQSVFARPRPPDLVHGDALLIDPTGALLAFRRSPPLRLLFLACSHLYVLSCVTFWSMSATRQLRFDAQWRCRGDADFALRALSSGLRPRAIRRSLAAFVLSGDNLGASPQAIQENQAYRQALPTWLKFITPAVNLLRWADKAIHGAYHRPRTLTYEIYPPTGRDAHRHAFVANRPDFRWPRERC